MSPAVLLLAFFSALAWGRSPVVVVVSDDLAPYQAPVAAFVDELGEDPWVVNINGRRAEARELGERLQKESPTAVFALGAKAAWTIRRYLPEVPLVYAAVLRPERYGIDGPGVVGVAMTVDPVVYLSQFSGFFTDVQKVGLLRGPSVADARIDVLDEAASEVGLELVVERVRHPRAVRRTSHELFSRVDALWVQPDRDILTNRSYRTLVEEARRRRVPVLVETDNMVQAGGLFAVVPDPEGVGRQAARLLRAHLDGEGTHEHGWFYPEEVQVVLNQRTLERGDIAFDHLLLDFVDQLVE